MENLLRPLYQILSQKDTQRLTKNYFHGVINYFLNLNFIKTHSINLIHKDFNLSLFPASYCYIQSYVLQQNRALFMSHKIALYLSDLMGGGTEWFALRLARGLSTEGFDPVFVVTRKEGCLLQTVAGEFPVFSLEGKEYNLKNLILGIPSLIKFLKEQQPDILVCSLPLINITAGIAAFFARTKTRLVFVEHMIVSQTLINRSRSGRFLTQLGLKLIYPTADLVIAVSEAAALDLLKLTKIPEHKIRIIYNPIIPEELPTLCQQPPEHPWLNERECPVILSVGRLLPVKNFEVLIKAVHEANEQRAMKLIILGEGEERDNLQKLINNLGLQKRIDLAGFKENVFSYMSAADLFVLPSESEAFGNVIAEALACGTPVISTDCGGVSEILNNGEYGELTPVGNAAQLSSAILRNLSKEHNRKRLKKQGNLFSVNNSVREYRKVLNGILSNNDNRVTKIKTRISRIIKTTQAILAKTIDLSTSTSPCLIIAPHPDDETFGCGTIIIEARKNNCNVNIVVVTDGGISTESSQISPSSLSAIRKQETLNACRILGVTEERVTFLNHRDGETHLHMEEIKADLARTISALNPRQIFSPYINDLHPDHAAIAKGVNELISEGKIPCPVYEYPVWNSIKEDALRLILLKETYALKRASSRSHKPKKMAAVRAYKSQLENLTGEDCWKTLDNSFIERITSPPEIFFKNQKK